MSKINFLSDKMKNISNQAKEEKQAKSANFQKILRNIDEKLIK